MAPQLGLDRLDESTTLPLKSQAKEGIKMKLITIATVGTAIALIGIFCAVLLPFSWLIYLTLIAWLISAAALVADIFRPDVRLRR